MACDDDDNGCIENDFCSRCLILKEKKMLNNFDDVNLVLASLVDMKVVEPIDDPNEFIVQEDYSWVLGMNTGDEHYYADSGEF